MPLFKLYSLDAKRERISRYINSEILSKIMIQLINMKRKTKFLSSKNRENERWDLRYRIRSNFQFCPVSGIVRETNARDSRRERWFTLLSHRRDIALRPDREIAFRESHPRHITWGGWEASSTLPRETEVRFNVCRAKQHIGNASDCARSAGAETIFANRASSPIYIHIYLAEISFRIFFTRQKEKSDNSARRHPWSLSRALVSKKRGAPGRNGTRNRANTRVVTWCRKRRNRSDRCLNHVCTNTETQSYRNIHNIIQRNTQLFELLK